MYRNYDERLVDRVMQIRGLLEAGLPTRIIKKILPHRGQLTPGSSSSGPWIAFHQSSPPSVPSAIWLASSRT